MVFLMLRHTLFIGFLAGLYLAGPVQQGHSAEKPLLPEQVRFFETNIRPLLIDHCQKCHGADKQKADLRLDGRDRILKGGESGPAAIAGEPEKSLLIRAVQHTDKDLKMPPGKKLTEREIADLTRW